MSPEPTTDVTHKGTNLVDVTLRDGGYLNDWEFSAGAVTALVSALPEMGVHHIEVGYLSDEPSRTELLRCDPALLADIRARCGDARLLGMTPAPTQDLGAFADMLRSRADLLDRVRITTTRQKLDNAIRAAEIARDIGLETSLNLISVTAYEPAELLEIVGSIAGSKVGGWLYLADSRGALDPEAAVTLFAGVRAEWPGHLGFHGHDNLGHALAVSAAAVDAGFDLIDASLGGIGLGGGNTDLAEALGALGPESTGSTHEMLAKVTARVHRDLPPPPTYDFLFELSGRKNLEQEWVPELWETFGSQCVSLLEGLPWARYQSLESILGSLP